MSLPLIPASGGELPYLASGKAAQQLTATVPVDITFDVPGVVIGTDISYSAPASFILQPGRTYRLSAIIGYTGDTDEILVQWVDSANSIVGAPLTVLHTDFPDTLSFDHGHVIAYVTPVGVLTVKVRARSPNGESFDVVTTSIVEIQALN